MAHHDDHERRGLIADITRRLALASHDELRVLDRLLVRLELGRERYGALDLRRPRACRRELGEELLDAVIYDTIDQVVADDRAHAALRAAAADEQAEIARWGAADQHTRVTDVSAVIARRDLDADREPYAAFDTSDVGGDVGGGEG